jgi:ribosome-binding ATPase
MGIEVGIVGLPNSGKTTFFNALTHAGADLTEYGKAHVGMAEIADERLGRVADVAGSAKRTAAVIRIIDVAGTEAAMLGELRRVDALLGVLNGFAAETDSASEAETIELELIAADHDHVQGRLERVAKLAKSGDSALRKEVEELERVLAHLGKEEPLRTYPHELPPELEPLTTKPVVYLVNGGPNGVDLKLEAELTELDQEEAAAFREGPPVLEDVVRALFEALDLISFFTANESEARAWTLRRGDTALDAAATIHSDMARGFIRCEVVRWDDLVESGSYAEAGRRGVVRLEGKDYEVGDGDVLKIRFNI